ncbi:M23 family metallopeptidase [Brevibacterium sp.]|uniref:M23 family metallopeptidase n=1 Tax=Brevibacterium sp. TaxID=1701 RepID=UPI00281230EA|nr:M23 family metallopeptidase [Brevibacterium sp.]
MGPAPTPLDIEYPFTGRWLVQNSPADQVPSHGTAAFASSYAIDFVPVDSTGGTAPLTFSSLVRPEPPDRFPGFGRPLLAPAAGTIIAAHDEEPDHAAHRGLPSITYMLTQQRRARAGWLELAGNHVFIEHKGVIVALCHLRSGSVQVRPGEKVRVGDPVGRCGNSGNSTEPHVHVQVLDSPDVAYARAVPLTFRGVLPRNGEIVDVDHHRHD